MVLGTLYESPYDAILRCMIKELPQEPTYFDCIGKLSKMGHDSDDGDDIDTDD